MRYVIICLGMAGRIIRNPAQPPPLGQFLKFYNPEAHDGQGFAEWTADPSEARIFADAGEAAACWQAVPKHRPRRPDGRPNRPLTAFTVEITPLEEDVAGPLIFGKGS